MSDVDLNDADFEAGFNAEPSTGTTTPPADATQATAVDESSNAPAAPAEQPKPEYVQLTKQERDDLMAKAAQLDEYRSEHTKKLDQAFGKIGGVQQLVAQLQAATQAGKQVTVSEEDFEELKSEGYEDLAQMTAAGLNRALAKMSLKGTEGDAPKFGEEQAKALFTQHGAELRKSLKDEVRQELAEEALTEKHADWKDVLNKPEFAEWSAKNKVADRKDRTGALFADSLIPSFIGDIITDFKASQKQVNARKDRLAAAVPPKGTGGHASSTQEEDEFSKGFNG